MVEGIVDEGAALDEQERLLRQELGSELEYLIDLAQAGMSAEEFRRSPAGMSVMVSLKQKMRDAIIVLRDPAKTETETLAAAYLLRVAYAAMTTISDAIEGGRSAIAAIDDHVS